MTTANNEAIERVLRLAAYFKARRGARVSLDDICANVPGYEATLDDAGRVRRDAAWEAVRKKLRRDLELLDDVFGIHVDFEPQRESYMLQPPFLAAEERDALVAAAALVRVDGIDDEQLNALGAAVDADGQRIVVRVHRHLLALRSALAARYPVRFRYHDTERVFEPWAVGLWRDRWYTVGWDSGHGERRVYRLDRIEEPAARDTFGPTDPPAQAVEPAGQPADYEVPEGFEADDALELDPNNWGHDPPVLARVEVDADWVQAFERDFGAVVEAPAHGGRDGKAVCSLTVRHYESFRDRLLGYGTHARLLEPESLVHSLRAWLVGSR
jgi:predicted DNA-binding transcriptional regulator YafY